MNQIRSARYPNVSVTHWQLLMPVLVNCRVLFSHMLFGVFFLLFVIWLVEPYSVTSVEIRQVIRMDAYLTC